VRARPIADGLVSGVRVLAGGCRDAWEDRAVRVLEEHFGPRTIVRVAECDCPACVPTDQHAFLMASVPGHERLWITVAKARRELLGESVEVVAGLHDDERMEGTDPATIVIEKALALIGMPWERLAWDEAMRQLAVWLGLPQWMMAVSVEQLWACRGVSFGRDLTRVPRALNALGYLPDAPVSRQALALLSERDGPDMPAGTVDGPPDMG
jgi:hypothetical protein